MPAHMGSPQGALARDGADLQASTHPLYPALTPWPSDQSSLFRTAQWLPPWPNRGSFFPKPPLVAMVTASLGCEWGFPGSTMSRMADLHLRRPKAWSSPGAGETLSQGPFLSSFKSFPALEVRSPHYVLTPHDYQEGDMGGGAGGPSHLGGTAAPVILPSFSKGFLCRAPHISAWASPLRKA